MKRYYFLNHNVTIDKDAISPGPRIIAYDSVNMDIADSYDSTHSLIKSDQQYIEFKKSNLKRAEMIVDKKYVVSVKDLVVVANPESRPPNLDYFLLMHTPLAQASACASEKAEDSWWVIDSGIRHVRLT